MRRVGGSDTKRWILTISLAPLWFLSAAVTWEDADLWTWPTESAGSGAATLGRWSDPRLLPTAPGSPPETLNPVHGVLVPQGRKGDILWFRNTRTFVFDLDVPESIEAMDYPDGPGDHQLFCCAQVPLESGDVLLVGGN